MPANDGSLRVTAIKTKLVAWCKTNNESEHSSVSLNKRAIEKRSILPNCWLHNRQQRPWTERTRACPCWRGRMRRQWWRASYFERKLGHWCLSKFGFMRVSGCRLFEKSDCRLWVVGLQEGNRLWLLRVSSIFYGKSGGRYWQKWRSTNPKYWFWIQIFHQLYQILWPLLCVCM